jgi:predicted metal-dependent hydrolase
VSRFDLVYWQSYVDALKDQLGLRDWKIIVREYAPEDEDHMASIGVTRCRKAAAVFFSDQFFREDQERQRQCVVHELLHCHFNHARFAFEMLSQKVHPETYETVFTAIDTHLELGIDGLAEAIAAHYPLPEAA